MAYQVANPPVKLSWGPIANFNTTEATKGPPNLWGYSSTDAIATVKAANYFSNAQLLGMRIGDAVLIFDITTPTMSLAFVQSLGTGNSVTLDGTPLTAT